MTRSRHPPAFQAVSVSWALENTPLLSCETDCETFEIFLCQFWPFPLRHPGCSEPAIPLSVTRLRKPSALAIASPFGAHSGLRPFHGFYFGFFAFVFATRGVGLAVALLPLGRLNGEPETFVSLYHSVGWHASQRGSAFKSAVVQCNGGSSGSGSQAGHSAGQGHHTLAEAVSVEGKAVTVTGWLSGPVMAAH